MAGGYQPGVPDPTDTSSADNASVPTGVVNFDDLTQFGVSPNIANIPVPFRRVAPKPMMMDVAPGVEAPAIPGRNIPGSDIENLSYEDAVRYLYGKDPDSLQELQLAMAAGGFYGTKPNFIDKTPDTSTRKSWDQVLQISMRTGKTPEEVIQGAVDANGGLEGGLKKHGLSSSGSTADIPVTHPDDIRMVAKEMSRKILGKGWNDAQLEKFVQSYQSMEQAEGTAAQAQGARYTKAPSVQAAVEEEARRQNPAAAGATDWDNAAQTIMKAFHTLGGGA